MSAPEPFDSDLPSPIAAILELGARAPGAVVTTAGMSDPQHRSYVPGGIEERIIELVESADRPDLIVVSGSAGGGKSALIASLLEQRRDLFNDDVIFDATHSESPDVSQADRLSQFFAPFADDAKRAPSDLTRLIAANTGMLILLFEQLKDRGGGFSCLESTLKERLGIPHDPVAAGPPWSLVVVNLDLRPTSGGPDALAARMLKSVNFDDPDGFLEGAPRCASCTVRAYCPVRTNAATASAAAGAIDALVGIAALRRGRHEPPRLLWDFVSRALTGDDTFDAFADPCAAVAERAAADDKQWVWDHLLPATLFQLSGDTGERVAELDPSLRPSTDAHRALTTAGIRPLRDADAILALPGGGEALETAASLVAAGDVDTPALGRALTTAGFLRDHTTWEFRDQTDLTFLEMLNEYEKLSGNPGRDFPSLWTLPYIMESAIGAALGAMHGASSYVPIKAYDPRRQSRAFVRIDLEAEDFAIVDDPARERELTGARLVAYRPISISVELAGVPVSITLPTFTLLHDASSGTVASTADLERFYALRRAVEALARSASARHSPLLVESPDTGVRFEVRRADGGQRRLTLRRP